MSKLTERAATQGHILVVDDHPANLKLLGDMLLRQGHAVHLFPLGRLALAWATKNPPDLILLDINMPEMDGYEVCERLQAIEALSGIPVIFLSALNDTEDKVKAFRSGAMDYISKPFQFEEVHARVQTHLQLHGFHQALKLDKERLEEVVAARTSELAEANRRLTALDGSKNEFLKLISHEFRTPLHGILGLSELILRGMAPTVELREMLKTSRRRILSILDDALLLTEIDCGGEPFRTAQVSLDAVLRRAIGSAADFAESRRVKVTAPSADLPLVLGNEGLLVRALQALIETAVRFSEEGETVRLALESVPDSLRVVIESRGKSIPSAVLARFFDLFSIAEFSTPAGDLGLGPAVACRILALFGASVSVANRDPSGIRLTISFKTAAPKEKAPPNPINLMTPSRDVSNAGCPYRLPPN
jgi:two-component system, sensor histidine kinase and response regulator